MNGGEAHFDLTGKRIWVAGHAGMVGSALVRRLEREAPAEILTATHEALDLTDQAATRVWLENARPDAVFVAAARVGGILANQSYPADFLYDNLMFAANVIHAAHLAGVSRLLYLGSSSIYPKHADQPMAEDALLTGALEPTHEGYAIAKIAGVKLCQAYRKQHGADFIAALPTNLYGPGDNYDLNTSHVIPALIRKVYEAKQAGADHVQIWGSGAPRREFLHADDCADALVHLMKTYTGEAPVNVGSGEDLTIEALVRMIMEVVGFEGAVTRDETKPDGPPRKLMTADRLRALGWSPTLSLRAGLEHAYACFLEEQAR
ncbi:GDP-L-fucose synthase family protein [Oceanicaulis sp. LC35]|uniref:GDP-L-fucose synthase family protein n=1 Tax=Oceanicaulis sp. LC35 TaxID=3349635 RepID=UPI003F845135